MIILAGVGETILYLAIGLVVGGVVGFLVARTLLKKQLDKNPPINENMIRAMFMSMGRKPSEKQIREVMRQMEKNK